LQLAVEVANAHPINTLQGGMMQRTHRSVLASMEPGTLYRTRDLADLTGLPHPRMTNRLRNLLQQGRIANEMRTTRAGHLVLWRLP
jgi:hypothetical protein